MIGVWVVMLLGGTELRLQPGIARPGEFVAVEVSAGAAPPVGRFGDSPLTFLPRGSGWLALQALSVDEPPGTTPVEVKAADVEWAVTIDIAPAQFRQRELTVSRRFTHPTPEERRRSKADQEAFARAFSRELAHWLFEDDFEWPRRAEITAPFGDLRTLNGSKQSQHFGLDLDGQVGTPITAANSGEVVLVRDCFASGRTVIIHHGGKLFTAYFHLSRFAVKQGQRVTQGQLLGKVGKTGRVTGPHLHFGVKLDGKWVDPQSLLRLRLSP